MSTATPQGIDVIKVFKRRKLIFNIMWYLGCILLAAGLLARRNSFSFTPLPENIEPWVLIGVAVPLFIGAVLNWRCPVCKRFFWMNTKLTSCTKCKTIFVSGDKRPF
jgi:hypothetical protein